MRHDANMWTARKWWPIGVYSLLALFVMAPLLTPGYILTLDMVFTPVIRLPANVSNDYLLRALLHTLNFVLPGDVIEKGLLFAILLLSGLGVYVLVDYLNAKPNRYQSTGAYFAGILYMVNPFTYDRLMAGQYLVIFGYALLPWFVRALLIFLRGPGLRKSATLAVWAATISIVSIHAVGFMVLLAAIATGSAVWRQGDKAHLRQLVKFGLVSVCIFLAASSYWLIPLALGKGSTAMIISNFSTADQSAFATVGGSWMGRVGNVVRLQGFWVEARGMYNLPQDVVPAWGLLALIIWVLVIVGGMHYWRTRQRFILVFFGLSAFIAGILAIGTLNGWLAAHIPFFAGYREPEKFVALVGLSFAVFAGEGIAVTLRYFHEQGGKPFLAFAGALLLLVPIVWTPTMWWGFNNQLAPVRYPADWFAMNRQLDADHSHFQTLFLPWHLYMYFDFAGRIIANPAPNFFDKPTIVSDNPEFRGAALSGSTPAKQQLDHMLPSTKRSKMLGKQLAPLNIKYVLLAKDDDYQQYEYLSKQMDLKLVAKSATLELYRNEAWKPGGTE